MIKEIVSKTLSRRDNMLVENERITIYHRPVRDGIWKSQHLEMSRMGLNMYNPLQAERSWGYKMTTTLSELRSSSIYYHINHSNHINHSSDKRDEGAKGRMGEGNKLQTETCSLFYSFTYSLNLN